MIVKGTYFQNDAERPLVYGDVEIRNIPRQRLRGEKEKDGILAESVFVGFCGTDHTLMNMGREGNLKEKSFPQDVTGSSTDTRVLYGFRLRIGLPSY